MKEFIITAKDDGRKLEKWLIREMPLVTIGQRRKNYRKNCYRVNGKPGKEDTVLAKGDVVRVFLNDELFAQPKRTDPFLSAIRPRLSIVYEDADVLIADKRPGLVAHPDPHEKVNTLLTHAQAYLYQKGEYDSMDPKAFAPALCNRIDRFTGGMVIIAKNAKTMHYLNDKIRERAIRKFYICIAAGTFSRPQGSLKNYIEKTPEMKKVRVSNVKTPEGKHAETLYRVLARKNGLSLVECELLTGRTHQIRAQMAFAKHPLLGDTQYGDRRINEKYGRNFQALYSYRLVFDFGNDPEAPRDLNGKDLRVTSIPFAAEYFPEVTIE